MPNSESSVLVVREKIVKFASETNMKKGEKCYYFISKRQVLFLVFKALS